MEDDYIKTEIKKYSGDYGVFFSIGHQTFKLDIPEDDEMTSLEYAKWYQRQLDAAFEGIIHTQELIEAAITEMDGFANWYLKREGMTQEQIDEYVSDGLAYVRELIAKKKKG